MSLLANSLALHAKLRIISAAKSLTILCLHRVAEPSNSGYGALSPELFDELLGWLKPRFNIITFAELGQQDDDPRPPLTLSFDDGYSDFYEIAMPILGRHGLKANQNVIPGCIESGLPPINVMVQDFLMSAPEKLLSEIKFPGHPAGFSQLDRARLALRMSATLKAKPMVEQQQILADLTPLFDRFDDFRTTPMMTRAQVAEIAGVHEIGAHSWEHASMSVESNDYVVEDARRCRSIWRTLEPHTHLSMPFPTVCCVRSRWMQCAQRVLTMFYAWERIFPGGRTGCTTASRFMETPSPRHASGPWAVCGIHRNPDFLWNLPECPSMATCKSIKAMRLWPITSA
ncbi:MAG: polysaccharide deacetylase family protein [Haliea sp.]|nr:polysaccharide deacetylase family protein [Haliea sp.]